MCKYVSLCSLLISLLFPLFPLSLFFSSLFFLFSLSRFGSLLVKFSFSPFRLFFFRQQQQHTTNTKTIPNHHVHTNTCHMIPLLIHVACMVVCEERSVRFQLEIYSNQQTNHPIPNHHSQPNPSHPTSARWRPIVKQRTIG